MSPLIAPLHTLVKRRALAYELARREILDRYLSQWIGGAWAILHPLLIMWLYVTLFTVVFPARLDGYDGGIWAGVTYLLAGLCCWLFSAEVLNRSTTAIHDSSSLVKQVVFPIEVIPVKTVFVATFSFVVTFLALIVVIAIHRPQVLLSAAYLAPTAILLHFFFLLGVSYLLSAIGAFVRDLKDAIAFFSAAGLFLAPILYFPQTLEGMPRALQIIITYNPFSHFVWMYQDSLMFGEILHPRSWAVGAILAVATPVFGHALFRRLSPQFGDVV